MEGELRVMYSPGTPHCTTTHHGTFTIGPQILPVVLQVTPVDVLGTATLAFVSGATLSPLSVVAMIAVVIAGVGLVTVAYPVVTRAATVDATLALAC